MFCQTPNHNDSAPSQIQSHYSSISPVLPSPTKCCFTSRTASSMKCQSCTSSSTRNTINTWVVLGLRLSMPTPWSRCLQTKAQQLFIASPWGFTPLCGLRGFRGGCTRRLRHTQGTASGGVCCRKLV
eukprot:PhF_6_TR44253/c0_g1_i1/m.68094